MASTVFLTGGTGYLGGGVLRGLLESGYGVRMLVRGEPRDLPSGELELVRGDLSDAARLARQMRGCGAAMHAAGMVSAWARDSGEFHRTNVLGLQNMTSAVRTAGVRTLVYTSSFFALGPAGPPGASEDSGLTQQVRHPYARTKYLARLEARAALHAGFPVVILYPGVIYGPGRETQGNIVGRLISDFLAGRVPGLLGDGTQVWSYAYIEDVVRGHLLALERCAQGGEYVLGGDNVSLRRFFELLSSLTGRAVPRLRVPRALGALAGAAEFIRARLGGRVPAMTPATVLMMYRNWACDAQKARRELGYEFRSLDCGLRSTLSAMNVPVLPGVV